MGFHLLQETPYLLPHNDYDPDDVTDPRHGMFGAGHDDDTPERADALNAFHRERGRAIRMLEKNNCLLMAI